MGVLSIHINTANIPGLLARVKSKWKGVSANQEFNYSFMDQEFDALYRSEQRMGAISLAFTSLAIIIACLGLFGLAAYAAEQRIREIGIRKVLGAKVSSGIDAALAGFYKAGGHLHRCGNTGSVVGNAKIIFTGLCLSNNYSMVCTGVSGHNCNCHRFCDR